MAPRPRTPAQLPPLLRLLEAERVFRRTPIRRGPRARCISDAHALLTALLLGLTLWGRGQAAQRTQQVARP